MFARLTTPILDVRPGNRILLALFASIIILIQIRSVHGNEGLKIESAGLAPQGSAGPGGAIVIRCQVRNTGDSSQEGMLVAKLTTELTSEDRCRVRVDAQGISVYEFPVRIPSTSQDDKLEIDVSMLTIRDGREVSLASSEESGTRRVTVWRPQNKRNIATALAMGTEPMPPPEWRWQEKPVFDTMECAIASRVDAELTINCLGFEAGPLPLNWLDWKGIDLLILAEPRYLRDQASIGILRAFLARGGRIWVMLDDIDMSLITPLLENHQSIRHIDTIGLRHLQVEIKNVDLAVADRTSTYKRSVPFKRITHSGGEVLHSIDGWPASLLLPVGRGELILTMLDAEGWIEPRKTPGQDPSYFCDYELRKWAKSITESLYVQRSAPLLKLPEISYPLERIGNPVVSRGLVTSMLLSFCVGLAAICIWRLTGREVSGIGWLLPALSIVASAPIALAGILQRKDIPNTVSIFQWIQFDNPSGGSLRESAAVYLETPASMDLEAVRNGFAIPDPKIQSGITAVVRDDLEHWQMTNAAWPAGTWRYTTDSLLPDNSMVAQGKWTANGLEVQLPADFPDPLSDPIISFVPGAPTLGKTKDGRTILVDGKYSAEGERWTLQSMVDDEQRRRSDIYRSYFGGNDRLQVQKRTLVGWSNLSLDSPRWKSPLESRGAALVSFPVVLQKAAIGAEVLVPHPFITIQNTDLGVSTPIFMDGIGKWITQSSNPSTTVVEFVLPEEVVPLRAKSIQISWDIEAPRRTARLSFIHPTHSTTNQLVELDAPSLPWESDLDDPRLLEAVGNGKLRLKIEVSSDREQGGTLPWRIRHLRLAVRGNVQAKHAWNNSVAKEETANR